MLRTPAFCHLAGIAFFPYMTVSMSKISQLLYSLISSSREGSCGATHITTYYIHKATMYLRLKNWSLG